MITDLVIIFFVSLFAATISGAAGFGGAILLIPILTNIVGIKAAIPILTIGQIFGNASRVWFGKKELKWKPIIYFLSLAIPLTILGSSFFAIIDANIIKIAIGFILFGIVIYRRLKVEKVNISNKAMILGGGLTGFISGIAGSAGPLGAAFFLGLGLTSTAYIASEACAALTMHLIKSLVYNKFSLIELTDIYYGLFIGVAMILGSWLGKKIIENLSKKKFIALVELLLFLSAIQMIISAL